MPSLSLPHCPLPDEQRPGRRGQEIGIHFLVFYVDCNADIREPFRSETPPHDTHVLLSRAPSPGLQSAPPQAEPRAHGRDRAGERRSSLVESVPRQRLETGHLPRGNLCPPFCFPMEGFPPLWGAPAAGAGRHHLSVWVQLQLQKVIPRTAAGKEKELFG